jgi:hypothetical protein
MAAASIPGGSFRQMANKANAQKSTGPRTVAGKAKSRINGVKHGLCCVEVVPEEDRAEYDARCARWVVEQRPESDADMQALRRAVRSAMQVDRCARREAKLVDQQYRKLLEGKAREALPALLDTVQRFHAGERDALEEQLGSAHSFRAVAVMWEEVARALQGGAKPDRQLVQVGLNLLLGDDDAQQVWRRLAEASLAGGPVGPALAFCRAEAELLRNHADHLAETDPDQAEEHRALLDEAFFLPDPELDRVRKYERAAAREYDRNYRALKQSRKEREREAKGQVAAGKPEAISPCADREVREETPATVPVECEPEAKSPCVDREGRDEVPAVSSPGKPEAISSCEDDEGRDGGPRPGESGRASSGMAA